MRIQDCIAGLAGKWISSDRVESIDDIAKVETDFKRLLPADYKLFLMWSDGGETDDPLEKIRFYPLEELLPRRADGQPPDTLEFATDFSDGFAFDLRKRRDTARYPIVRYPLGEISRDEVEQVADHFGEFLEKILASTL